MTGLRHLAGAAALTSIGAFIAADLAPSGLHSFLACAVVFVGAVPLLLELSSNKSRSSQIIISSCFAIGLLYGIPVFLVSIWAERGERFEYYNLWFENTEKLFPIHVLMLALAGVFSYVFACMLMRHVLQRSPLHIRFLEPKTAQLLNLMLWALFAVNLASHFVPQLDKAPSFGQFAKLLGPICFGYFLTEILRRRLGLVQTITFMGLQGSVFVQLLSNTLLMPLIVYALVAVFVLWRIGGKFPKYFVIVSALLVFAVYNAAYSAREFTWKTMNSGPITIMEKVGIIGSFFIYDLTGQKWGFLRMRIPRQNPTQFNVHALKRMVQRFSHLSHLSVATAVTPAKIPFWEGSSYTPLASSFIPRILWSDKPTETLGSLFAQDYWTETKNKNMSMNLPWLPELYLNFGHIGVIFGMAIFGMLLALVDRLLNSEEATDLEAVVGLVVLVPFLFPDSNFSVMNGSAVPLIVSLWVYFRLGAPFLDRFAARGLPFRS